MDNPDSATVAEAIRRHRVGFLRTQAASAAVRQLIGLLPLCRTAALGGHLYRCDACGYAQPRYNSCGNRHCPACQAKAREQWLAQQEAALLPLRYFHLVFTLPEALQPLLLQNQTTGYNLLFQCAAQTLLAFGRDPKHQLAGQLGFTAVLHTWDQRLRHHPHLHVLIPAGALSADKRRFIQGRQRRWIFPVRALSKVLRAMFLKRLKAAHAKGKLGFWGQLESLQNPKAFEAFLQPLYHKDWVVFAKAPFAGPEQVLQYLGRYTHRVGISNARIQEVTDQHVTFTYRDRKDQNRKKLMTLEGVEFLRRFFLHVLPKGFTRIRHYGFLGNAVRHANLAIIREILGEAKPEPMEETPVERMARVYGIELDLCPCCRRGRMKNQRVLLPVRCKDPPCL
jgi:hypothetical protein